MERINIKTKSIRKFLSIGSLLILIFITSFVSYGSYGVFMKMMDSAKYRRLTEANLAELTLREKKLQEEVSSLDTERGVEKEIRERFPVLKPGEEVIMIVDEDQKDDVVKDESQTWYEKLSSWWSSL